MELIENFFVENKAMLLIESRHFFRKLMMGKTNQKPQKSHDETWSNKLVWRYNQAEIKNTLTKMQSKLDALTARVNEVEERVSDIEDKLMVRRKLRKKEKNN